MRARVMAVSLAVCAAPLSCTLLQGVQNRDLGSIAQGTKDLVETGAGAKECQKLREPMVPVQEEYNIGGVVAARWVKAGKGLFLAPQEPKAGKNADTLYLTFDAPEGNTFTVDYDAYIQPASQRGQSATVSVVNADLRPLTTVHIDTLLLPLTERRPGWRSCSARWSCSCSCGSSPGPWGGRPWAS